MSAPASNYERIYAVVRRVPRGRVATYGQIATLAGLGGHARQVGYALNAMPDDPTIPWHRVINAKGEISIRGEPGASAQQRRLLEAEGVRFNAQHRVPLKKYRWQPRR
jgi:methylated-DNA-protein-cysteine methyltransferase-like protein